MPPGWPRNRQPQAGGKGRAPPGEADTAEAHAPTHLCLGSPAQPMESPGVTPFQPPGDNSQPAWERVRDEDPSPQPAQPSGTGPKGIVHRSPEGAQWVEHPPPRQYLPQQPAHDSTCCDFSILWDPPPSLRLPGITSRIKYLSPSPFLRLDLRGKVGKGRGRKPTRQGMEVWAVYPGPKGCLGCLTGLR